MLKKKLYSHLGFLKPNRILITYLSILFTIALLDRILRAGLTTTSLFIEFLFLYIVSCFLYLFSPRSFKILTTLLIIISALSVYVLDILGVAIHPSFIWMILRQASAKEVWVFLDIQTILIIFCVISLSILVWRKTKIPITKSKPKFYTKILAIFLSIIITNYSYIFLVKFVSDSLVLPIPYVLFHPKRIFLKTDTNQPSFIEDLEYHDRDINIVLHIGETARADHFGINGYKKNPTTPNLEKIPLINFGTARSCGTLTLVSWKYIHSNTPCTEDVFDKPQKPLPFYFAKFGFETFMVGQVDELSLFNVIKETKTSSSILNFDQNIYKAYKALNKKSSKSFFILNSFGSHLPYNALPENAKKFTPNCRKDTYKGITTCSIQEVVNSFDNTIAFLDETVSKVLKNLEINPVPSLYLYISDHGEDLNDTGNNYYGHGTQTIENHMVPFFVYTNKAFQTQYPNQYKTLLYNAKQYKDQMAQDVIWNSIMDIAGFTNKDGKNIIDYKRSIFSSQLLPRVKKNWFKVDYNRN